MPSDSRSILLLALVVSLVPSAARAADDTTGGDTKASCLASSEQGQQQRDELKYRGALASFSACAREVCPLVVRRDCAQWVTELEDAAPTIVVSAQDPDGHDLSTPGVWVDGQALPGADAGRPVIADPGEHVLRFAASGWPAVEQHVVLRAGEKNRVIRVRFVREGKSKSSRKVPTFSWLLGGVAVLAFASEAYFGISGLDERSKARAQTCAPYCPQSDETPIRTKFIAADVSLSVGVVSATAALVTWLSRRQSAPTEAGAVPAFDVRVTNGGAFTDLRLRF